MLQHIQNFTTQDLFNISIFIFFFCFVIIIHYYHQYHLVRFKYSKWILLYSSLEKFNKNSFQIFRWRTPILVSAQPLFGRAKLFTYSQKNLALENYFQKKNYRINSDLYPCMTWDIFNTPTWNVKFSGVIMISLANLLGSKQLKNNLREEQIP